MKLATTITGNAFSGSVTTTDEVFNFSSEKQDLRVTNNGAVLIELIINGDIIPIEAGKFYSHDGEISTFRMRSKGGTCCYYLSCSESLRATFANLENRIGEIGLAPFFDELDKTPSGQTSTTRRWFCMREIPKGSKISTVKFLRQPAEMAADTKVEVWEFDGTNYNLAKSVTITDRTTGLKTITINYITKNPAIIAFNGDGVCIYTTSNQYTYIGPAGDLTSTTLAPTSITKYGGDSSLMVYIDGYNVDNYVNVNIKKVRGNDVTVGKWCDYSNPQDAIVNARDSASNHVTIRLKPGTYSRFSMVRDGAGVLIPGNPVRYISMIADNPYKTIIYDDTGNYHTPSAELKTNGLIYGIGFIATHDNPTPDNCGSTHKSYAAHIDFGPCDMQLEWCRFISYQAPGIGMGLAQDMKVKIKNCDIESYATADYGGLVDFGGLFVHSQDAADITGQILILDNCRVFSQNGNKAAWFSHMSSGTSSWKITSYNSMFYGATCGKVVSITKDGDVANLPTITADSYGNNVTELNPAL